MKLCVDASFLLYRARFVAQKSDSCEWDDIASIFMTSLLKVAERFKPTQIYSLFDDGRSEHRVSLIPDYKSNRDHLKEADDPIYQAFVQAKNFLHENLSTLGFVSIMEHGIEADDFAYLIASDLYSEGVHVTEDHDWYLNLFENWSIYHPRADKLLTYFDLVEMTGYETNPRAAFLVAKSLVGDNSDNIKGVKGIGWESAQKFAIPLLEGKPLGEGARAKLIEENKEIVSRNMHAMDPVWVSSSEQAKTVLARAEINCPVIRTPLPRWMSFAKQFPKGPNRSNMMAYAQKYSYIIRRLAA